MTKRVLSLFASFFALLFLFGCSSKGEEFHVKLVPEKTGITTIRYFDTARERPLLTEVWYPVEESEKVSVVSGMWIRCPEARDVPVRPSKERYPLVVFSHGNWGDRTNNAWLAEILASNGFIVAAVDHHGNTWNNKIAECFIRIWERPLDVKFVIDELLKDTRFSSHIDPHKIGLVGYSLGGHTGLWVAGGRIRPFEKNVLEGIPAHHIPAIVTPEILQQTDFSPVKENYRDERVSAVFLMAPALVHLFEPESLQAIDIPLQVVACEGDKIVPTEKSAKLLADLAKNLGYKLIPGFADHYVFINEPSKAGKMLLDKTIVTDHSSVDRHKVHEEVATEAVLFFKRNLK